LLESDPEAKYAFVRAYKDVGNTLFKAGNFAWAIRTYVDGVSALAAHCYQSREYMLWDYFARVPCGQCYSNAALCALKLGEAEKAAALCARAMECKPEDTDLVKVLLRHGQALLALGRAEAAKGVLERAADKEPSNRAVREELLKAKKLAAAAAKEADRRLFSAVNLHKQGLTSKRESEAQQLQQAVDSGFEALVNGKDAEAINLLKPLVVQFSSSGAGEAARHRRPSAMLATYGVGIAHYHAQRLEETVEALGLFFKIKGELDGEGLDYVSPLTGVPLARFYYAHALFNTQRLSLCKEQLTAYFVDAEAAGPQRILNMPSSMLGREISDAERAASRFKVRACASEARADAHTMLAMIAEREHGPAASEDHLQLACKLASKKQKVDAFKNLARLYDILGDDAKREEQEALARTLAEELASEEAEAARKKAEQDATAGETEELKDETVEEPSPETAAEPVLAD